MVIYSFASAKEYDGIWFLGMNLKHDLFKDRNVRTAINYAVDRDYISTDIVSEETTPVSFIPPGMIGYDPDLESFSYDQKYAKLIMKKAGYPINDPRLKTLTLLHTDGIKTVAIAEKIRTDLKSIGIKVELVQVSFQEESKWATELSSGKYDFFLMGYKAGMEELFSTEEATASLADSYSLVEPLFKTGGDANFTGYSNPKVDELLDKLTNINIALKEERHKKLKEINSLLRKDLPVVVLFYIEKL
ncbi:MAG: ABC transporter substrate-binding protein [Candidatus Margulisbacteria bacterium]|nr:ABC transporter substrate-binding protein [Candidatus Margulisiibacteriota bacterium]